jgi:hypothetical protein
VGPKKQNSCCGPMLKSHQRRRGVPRKFVIWRLATRRLALPALSLPRIKCTPLIFHTPHSAIAGAHQPRLQRARGEAHPLSLAIPKRPYYVAKSLNMQHDKLPLIKLIRHVAFPAGALVGAASREVQGHSMSDASLSLFSCLYRLLRMKSHYCFFDFLS